MARLYEPHDDHRHGSLIVEPQSSTECIHVFYVPSKEKIEQSGMCIDTASNCRVKLLELDNNTGRFTIFPINTLSGHTHFLKPKHKQIERITLADGKRVLSPVDNDLWSPFEFSETFTFGPTKPLEDNIDTSDIARNPQSTDEILEILESLPSGFTKDYDHGLGLAKGYRFIVEAVEELTDCKEIVISRRQETGINPEETSFHISTDDFETMRKSLNSRTTLSRTAARSVKKTETYNFLAEKIGHEQIPLKLGRHRIRNLLTREPLAKF